MTPQTDNTSGNSRFAGDQSQVEDDRTVAASVAGRTLTHKDVTALPDTTLRRLLLSSFGLEASAGLAGHGRLDPTPMQFVNTADDENNPKGAPMLVRDGEYRTAAGLLHYLCDAVTEFPDELHQLVIPNLPGEATFVALTMLYEDWLFPPGHSSDDTRDPADVPDSTAARVVRGITVDNVHFVVTRPRGEQPTARVELLASRACGDGPESADRVRDALTRAVGFFEDAYAQHADGAPDVSERPPASEPTPRRGLSPRAATVHMVDANDHPLGNLTRADVEALPESQIRTIVLAALTILETHHGVVTWTGEGPYVFRHTLADVDPDRCDKAAVIPAPDDDIGMANLLIDIAYEIGERAEVRELLSTTGHDYLAVSVLAECWINDDVTADDNRAVADIAGSYEALFVVGVTREGGMFHLIHPRDGEPRAWLAYDMDDAASRFAIDDIDGLHMINKVFIELDPTPPPAAEPTATLAELPDRADFGDNRFVMLSTRWKRGEPRPGPIYPPLPHDHPLARQPCACIKPLSDDTPVQTFVTSPAKEDDIDAFFSGEWCDAHAALVHQRCMDWLVAQYMPVVFALHKGMRRA